MIKAIALTGPTASGKTALSLRFAKEYGAEIISCDSMQIYRGMDIGTAKADSNMRRAVPHHMIDIIEPNESFSTRNYKDMAIPIAKEIYARGKIPFFVGGTGLYIDTLIRSEGEEVPAADEEYRNRMLDGIKTEEDKDALWQRLFEIDPESAALIHKNNVRRVIRAIEIYEKCGKTKSYFDRLSRMQSSEIDIFHITLAFHDRDTLYERIDKRVDLMLAEGLYEEVLALYKSGKLEPSSTASQAIGYKEIVRTIENGKSITDAVDEIKQASRNYAKRQLTWFRHSVESGARVLYADDENGKIKDIDLLYKEFSDIIATEKFI